MSEPLLDVLAELRELLGTIDQAAVLALRAQADAQEAQAEYREAGTGSNRPDIRRAHMDARTAAEKAGKTARLLAEAANAFADYTNIIAPSTVASRHSAPEATPTGESLIATAPSPASRIDGFLAELGINTDDTQEAITTTVGNVAAALRIVVRDISGDSGPHGSVTTAPAEPAGPSDSAPGAVAGDFVSAAVFSVLAVAVAARALKNVVSTRPTEEHAGEHEK